MNINTSVDIGDNLTSLLEQLAQHIGRTADTVFSWYVQQAYIEGVIAAVSFCGLFFVSIMTVIIGWRTHQKHQDDTGLYATVIGTAILCVLCLVGAVYSSDIMSKIYNPHYHAIKALSRDIRALSLLGGR